MGHFGQNINPKDLVIVFATIFNKCLLIFYVAGIVRGAGNKMIDKTDSPALGAFCPLG